MNIRQLSFACGASSAVRRGSSTAAGLRRNWPTAPADDAPADDAVVRNKRGTGEAQSGARGRCRLRSLVQAGASPAYRLATFGQPGGKRLHILVAGRAGRPFLFTRNRSRCRIERFLGDGLTPDAGRKAPQCVADREGLQPASDVRTKGGLFGRHRHEPRSPIGSETGSPTRSPTEPGAPGTIRCAREQCPPRQSTAGEPLVRSSLPMERFSTTGKPGVQSGNDYAEYQNPRICCCLIAG